MTTDSLNLPADVLERLQALRTQPKFVPFEPSEKFPLGYVGYLPAEEDRAEAESHLNDLISQITTGIKDHPSKAFVLQQFSQTFAYFQNSDTEDRERLCYYLEDIMDAVGMASSDGVINKWMYGF